MIRFSGEDDVSMKHVISTENEFIPTNGVYPVYKPHEMTVDTGLSFSESGHTQNEEWEWSRVN